MPKRRIAGGPTKSLPESIEALYDAFRKVPRPGRIDGCPCCIDSKNLCGLLSNNLRALTVDDLSSYAASASLTGGDEDDYLYFLPRIIELTSTEPEGWWWVDPEITGRAIARTQPAAWPKKRQTALLDVLHATIADAASRADDGGRIIDSWICAISLMGFKVEPFLNQIAQSPTSVLAYYEENAQSLSRSRLSNSFWDPTDEGYQQAFAWFQSDRIARLISEAYGIT